jgi:hypothetical protein
MKSIALFVVIALTIFFVACHKQQQLKARIFERRELNGNRLMIQFKYTVKNKLYTDSATIANLVINNDSISIIIDPENPAKAIPELK